ncbi:HEPN domain-containing protein [Flavobacterium sp. 2]|uniref:HEPN domain-containing protein n=1 Tax=Flavobacterium sp. 2 TaxID=308053 RepID=UPI003CE6D8CA
MKNDKLSNTIFLQAKRFEDSAELLFKFGISDPNKYFIPAWVMASFSLELYLKSILQYEKGTIKKTHSIETIFNELTEDTKDKIRRNFKADIIKNPPRNIKELEEQSGIKISNDFDNILSDISSLFVDFRYIFEQKNETKSFIYIENLRSAITERVLELGIGR